MRVSIVLIMLVVVVQSRATEPNEAEKLFLDMEKKITGAKTIVYDIEAKIELGTKKITGKGSVIIGGENKVRFKCTNNFDGETMTMMVVSDGLNMQSGTDDKASKSPTPKSFGELNRAAASRSGLFLPFFFIRSTNDDFKASDFSTSDFKLGKKEKIGGSDAQEIQYTFKMPDMKDPVLVSLWLDLKTNLPAKRSVVASEGSDKLTFTETYSKFTLDSKVDPKSFEVK